VGTDFASKLYNGGNWITVENYFGITSVYPD
jgi:D-alanyl-D-alanine carboxypeptidase